MSQTESVRAIINFNQQLTDYWALNKYAKVTNLKLAGNKLEFR